MAQAEAGVNSLARQLAEEYPKQDAGMKIVLTPPGLAGNYIRGPVSGFASALFAVSSLVLPGGLHQSSMLLARASDRRKETAIRLAVGASRGRLIHQLLTDNLVVALAGGASAALLVLWITDALASWRSAAVDVPITLNVTPDARVFLFALLISVLTLQPRGPLDH